MDLNTDELRRQLREAEQEQRVATRSMREVLQRLLDPPPSAARRRFFRTGGAAVLGAAVLAACGDDDEGVAETGSSPTTAGESSSSSSTTGTSAPDDSNMDLVLARTAASTELVAVAAYTAAIDSGIVTTQAVADAATLFRTHHEEHAGVFNAVIREAGGEEVTEPNAFLMENLVATADLSSELSIVQFARSLEDAAAGTYVFAAGVLSTPELRQATMSIGGVEARHATALDLALQALGQGSGPAFEYGAFYGTANRVPDEALLT